MISAYQKGELANAPAKVKRMSKTISPAAVGHFAKTKESDLPDKVAYERGFFKAAVQYGFSPVEAVAMYKHASDPDLAGQGFEGHKLNSMIPAGLGAGVGAGIGGLTGLEYGLPIGALVGLANETTKEKAERDYMRGGFGGAVKGGLVGGGGGALLGAGLGGLGGYALNKAV